jgi:hypothetical protein
MVMVLLALSTVHWPKLKKEDIKIVLSVIRAFMMS